MMWINFGRPHKSLADPYPRTPAMAAGVADQFWPCEEIAARMDQRRDNPCMRWWLWILVALITFGAGIAVGAASYWFAESAGPMSGMAVATFGASLLMAYIAAPGLAVKGVVELWRAARRR